MDLKQIIERYKTDKDFKMKILKSTGLAIGAILFLIFIAFKDKGKVEEKNENLKNTSEAPVDDYFIADTSNIVDDKNEIYKFDQQEKGDGSELVLGKVESEKKEEDTDIDAYIQNRERQLSRMNNSSSSSPSYNETPRRRSYNPNPPVETIRRDNYFGTQEEQNNTPEPIVEKKKDNSSGFFKKKGKTKNQTIDNLTIYASIHTNQTIMNNQRVKFRTTKEFTYNGVVYPINTIVYGLANIQPNRLMVKINRINQTEMELDVYDSEDSQQGLYVLTPNLNASLAKEMKRESLSDDDLQKIPFSKSLKNIFEKKVREEKIQLLNNYKVLIKVTIDEKK